MGVCFAFMLVLGASFAHAQVDGDVVTDPGLDGGQVEVATSTDGTGGLSGVGGTITTGDATASTSVDNQLNHNQTNPDSPGETNSSAIAASTTNDGTLTSQSTTTASSGENTAEGDMGIATIVTGTAEATANVINVVNTNIFNSTGLIIFLNQLFGGGLDLRDFDLSYFFDGGAGASPDTDASGERQCTLLSCLNSSSMVVEDTNAATVTNEVVVRAATGDNEATSVGPSPAADAFIRTGDAYAAANVINLVNTNIINSSYLFLSFNNFGDLHEDIILPNQEFFTRLLASGGSAPELNSSSYDVDTTNTVDVIGTTTVQATTGDNLASSTGEGSGVVVTGDAYSAATAYTDANSTYFGGTSVFFLFRIAGAWAGEVVGLPDGLSWTREFETYPTGQGVSTSTLLLITTADTSSVPPQSPRANCDDDAGPVNNCYNSSSFAASSTNTALVENLVDVSASTGGNQALTASGTAEIITGKAYAAANIVNLINTNIVGRNWMMAMFNVFGDFDGDISFGDKPNLGEIIDEFDDVVVSTGGGGGGGGGSVKLTSKNKNKVAQSVAGNPDITVTKYASVSTTSVPTTVDYTVVVQKGKKGGNAHGAVLTDSMVGPSGDTVMSRSWDLDVLAPGDYIAVSYSVQFAATSTPGAYVNTARVDATQNNTSVTSEAVSHTVQVVGGAVLGAQAQCVAIPPTLRYGMSGAMVGVLQRFLNTQGHTLPPTGYFGPMTHAAVMAFQRAHAADVLAPIGLAAPTGFVGPMTVQKITALSCAATQ